jgi:hypothetical protein
MDRPVDIRLRSPTRCRASTNGPEAKALNEAQAAQLIVFVVVVTALLLALEVGLRRAHRRR